MAKKNTSGPKGATPQSKSATKVNAMPFGRKNYLLLFVCLGLLALGYIVMASETAQYGFGDLGLVWGPILLFAGFVVGVVAILIKPTEESTSDTADS